MRAMRYNLALRRQAYNQADSGTVTLSLLAELHEVVDELVHINLAVFVLVEVPNATLSLRGDLRRIGRFAGMFVERDEDFLELTGRDRSALVSIDVVERLRQRLSCLLRTASHLITG